MKRLVAAALSASAVLVFAGAASAGVSVGVNDDAGKYADGGAQFWQTMAQTGLRQNAMTVLWDETRPTTIVDESFIRDSLPAAEAAGSEVVFDVYPMHSQALTSDPGNVRRFAAFVGQLARTFPQVREYVVMNECNQTRFVNPQFDGKKQNQSAALCGQALAAAYDALKAIDPSIFVWGIGLSPRGNDNADASSNVSTSPVKFLGYLGRWYRSSGRTRPIMDGFDFHPYPIPQSLPFAKGYAATDNASVSNLSRIYQAFYDAFAGTAQPTIGQQAGGGLPVSLNEVGIQTLNTGRPGYTGTENAANANGGVRGGTATEAYQASWYTRMLDLVACDPNVRVVNLFHLVDESDLGGWQSGLFYVGYQPKQSAAAVREWIAQTGGRCTGQTRSWTPVAADTTMSASGDSPAGISLLLTGSLGSFVSRVPGTSFDPSGSLADAIGLLSSLLGSAQRDLRLTVTLTYVGGASPVSARGVSSAAAGPVARAMVTVRKGAPLRVTLRTKRLKTGYYTLRYDLEALPGGARASVTTKAFYLTAEGRLGAPSQAAAPAKPGRPAKPAKPAKPKEK